jgi:hypothetical protein
LISFAYCNVGEGWDIIRRIAKMPFLCCLLKTPKLDCPKNPANLNQICNFLNGLYRPAEKFSSAAPNQFIDS